jgi:hypothetical protein
MSVNGINWPINNMLKFQKYKFNLITKSFFYKTKSFY